MKLKQTALALALGAMAASAQALTWKGDFQTSNGSTLHDDVLRGIDGMDLYSDGSAAFFCASISGCGDGTINNGDQLNPVGTNLKVGDIVTTVYQGVVSSINPGVSAPNLIYPGHSSGTYQITVAAMFREVVTGGFGATAILEGIPGGRISFFFDDSTLGNTFITDTASILAGTGYTDGLVFADGPITGAITTFSVLSQTSASGFATVLGKFDIAQLGVDDPTNTSDVVGFMPDTPDGFTSSTTLQYGDAAGGTTNHQTENFFDNDNGWTSFTVNKDWVVLADANSHFTVPEPTTLALLGLGLAGLGLSLRRRAA